MSYAIFENFKIVLLFALALHAPRSAAWQHTRVEVPDLGSIYGSDKGDHISYESIPYAEPPVGELRFAAPKPFAGKWPQGFNATRTPPVCLQWSPFVKAFLTGEEDCLMLNIYKPKSNSLDNNEQPLPVLVFIHGGAFMYGNVHVNEHKHFMQSGRLIVVKFAYRLGPLGFLSTEDSVIAGNFGLKDQHLAMKWIRQNIVYFGGDADSILLTGFSAGGASVHLHMLSANYPSYARAAVSFSGCALNPWVIQHTARQRAFELAKHLTCPSLDNSSQILQCLRNSSAKAIVSAVSYFLVFHYNPFSTFGPVVESAAVGDSAFITAAPELIIKSGNFHKIPWLASYVAQDGAYSAAEFLQKMPRSGEEMIEVLNDRWYDLAPYMLFYKDVKRNIEELDDYSMALKARYLGDKRAEFSLSTYPQLQRMYTDVLYRNGIERSLLLHRQIDSTQGLYSYVYDNPASQAIIGNMAKRNDIQMGTLHGDDVFLIFRYAYRKLPMREDEQIIVNNFVKMLENFAKNSSQLSFGGCKFVSHVGRDKLQFMLITREKCENQEDIHLPSLMPEFRVIS